MSSRCEVAVRRPTARYASLPDFLRVLQRIQIGNNAVLFVILSHQSCSPANCDRYLHSCRTGQTRAAWGLGMVVLFYSDGGDIQIFDADTKQVDQVSSVYARLIVYCSCVWFTLPHKAVIVLIFLALNLVVGYDFFNIAAVVIVGQSLVCFKDKNPLQALCLKFDEVLGQKLFCCFDEIYVTA